MNIPVIVVGFVGTILVLAMYFGQPRLKGKRYIPILNISYTIDEKFIRKMIALTMGTVFFVVLSTVANISDLSKDQYIYLLSLSMAISCLLVIC